MKPSILVVMSCLFTVSPLIPSAVLGQESAVGATTTASAKFGVVRSEPIPVGERIVLHSKALGREVSMNLYLPDSFDVSSDAHTYPVIFSNGEHGNQFFTVLCGIVKHLGDRERIPESIVVSLNDMERIPEIYTHGMWGREIIDGDPDPELAIRHLEAEVIPYLEKHYRANHYRILIGVSGSSLFPIYTWTEAPELFDSHILVAAADTIGMGFSEDESFIETFTERMKAAPDRQSNLYVGVADKDVEKNPEYRDNLDALRTALRPFENVNLRAEVVENTEHYEVFIKSVLAGLDLNFPEERWSSRYRDLVAQPGDALENIDRYYEQLSKDYGFRVLPRADRWNNVNSLRFMIRHLIREGRAAEAVPIARRRIEYRPKSAPSYSGLADALEAVGDLPAAVAAQKEAVALSSPEERESAGERQLVLEERLATELDEKDR